MLYFTLFRAPASQALPFTPAGLTREALGATSRRGSATPRKRVASRGGDTVMRQSNQALLYILYPIGIYDICINNVNMEVS